MAEYQGNQHRDRYKSTLVPPRTNGELHHMGGDITERIIPLTMKHLIILVGFVVGVTTAAVIGWFDLRADVGGLRTELVAVRSEAKAEALVVRCNLRQVSDYMIKKQVPRPGDC